MIRIDYASVKEKLVENGFASRVWLQWFVSIGDAIGGLWGVETLAPVFGGTVTTDTTLMSSKMYGLGKTVQLNITFTSVTTSSGSITLPFSVEASMLQYWDSSTNTLVGGAYASGTTITLPDATLTSAILTGTLVRL